MAHPHQVNALKAWHLAEHYRTLGTLWFPDELEGICREIGEELFDLCGEPDDSPDLSLFVDDGISPAARYVEFQFATVREFGADADQSGQLLTIARRCIVCKVRPAQARVRPLKKPRYCSDKCMRRHTDRSPRKAEYRRKWAAAERERRRTFGLCVICGNQPHLANSVRCEPCRAKRRSAKQPTTPRPEL